MVMRIQPAHFQLSMAELRSVYASEATLVSDGLGHLHRSSMSIALVKGTLGLVYTSLVDLTFNHWIRRRVTPSQRTLGLVYVIG